jgi:hypothetical protein
MTCPNVFPTLGADLSLPGVVLAGAGQAFEIRLADGCQEVQLTGLKDAPRGLSIRMGRGTSLRIDNCQLPGRRISVLGQDAQIFLEDVRCVLNAELSGGSCSLRRCVVSSTGRMIQTSGSRIEIIGSRLNFAGTGNGLNITGGTLRFEGVFLDAPGLCRPAHESHPKRPNRLEGARHHACSPQRSGTQRQGTFPGLDRRTPQGMGLGTHPARTKSGWN